MRMIFSIVGIFLFNVVLFNQAYAQQIRDILLIDDNSSSKEIIYNEMINAGYRVDVVVSQLITPEDIQSHRLIFLTTGNNPNACANSYMRSLLRMHSDEQGKIIVEGGQSGYTGLIYPSFLGFSNKVLKAITWHGNFGGNLHLKAEHSQSNIANVPNLLPAEINLNVISDYDQDVNEKVEFAETFYGTASNPNYAGIIIAPNVSNPQIINFCFSFGALVNRNDAKLLLVNTIFNLIGNPVSVNQLSENAVDFKLYQNFPNPFNPLTKIKFDIPSNSNGQISDVKLFVFDVLGREVKTLVDGKLNYGSYEVEFNAGNVPSGVYYYRLNVSSGGSVTTNYSVVRKMVLLK